MNKNNEDKINSDFSFDAVFREKLDYLKYNFDIYHRIYDLKTIKYSGEVSNSLFEYAKKRDFFILLVIYDEEGKIYLERNIQEKLCWALPGGSISKNEDIHSAVRRISKKINDSLSSIIIGEIEPIAFVENNFFYNSQHHIHHGIAFCARVRNKKNINFDDVQGCFINVDKNEISKINRFANKEVVKICLEKIKNFNTKFPEFEISVNEKNKIRYLINEKFLKRFILTKRLCKKVEFFNIIKEKIGNASSFIDVSCGDNNLVFKVANDCEKMDYVVANDISWSQISTYNNKNVIFTNHNSCYLPFAEKAFDVAYCGNTLHHMPTREELIKLLESMDKVAQKIIIVEIENPYDTGGLAKIIHDYLYVGFLKDAGGSYLSKKAFQSIISGFFSKKSQIIFSEFKNIKGRYLIAEITKHEAIVAVDTNNLKKDKVIELEEKFICQDQDGLEKFLINNNFKLKETLKEDDDYFTELNGEFIKNRTCLRLRSTGEKSEITFKGSSSSFSNLYIKTEHNLPVPIGSEESYRDFLNSLGFFKYVLVEKYRKIYQKEEDGLLKNVVIDMLPKIGSFIELEILADFKQYQYKHEYLQNIFSGFKSNVENFLSVKADLPYRDYVAKFVADNILKKNELKAIVFDFDGTIIPSEDIFLASYSCIAKKYFYVGVSIEDYKKWELNEEGKLFAYLIEKYGNDLNVKQDVFMDEVYEDYDNRIKVLFSNEKIAINFEIISLLKKYGLKIGIVSTSKRQFIDKILEVFDKKDLFDCIVAREDVNSLKPDPEGYLKILETMNLSIENVLVVEDSLRGIKSAKSANLNCVGVYENSLFSKEELSESNIYITEDLAQIFLLLNFS